jgi:hypothetical protein
MNMAKELSTMPENDQPTHQTAAPAPPAQRSEAGGAEENKGEWNQGRQPGRGTYPMNDDEANQDSLGVPGAHGQTQEDPFHTPAGDEVTEEIGKFHTEADQRQADARLTQPKD